jgi:predicted RNA methylase
VELSKLKNKIYFFFLRNVTLIDIDPDAIEIAKQNIENLDLTDRIEIININVNEIPLSFYKKFDIVLTNPPFGIRSQKAADVNFLKQAINVI